MANAPEEHSMLEVEHYTAAEPRMPTGPEEPMTAEERERQRRKVQKQLDEALEDSFPASDPVSIVTSQTEEDWEEGPGAGTTIAPRSEPPPAR
jgi:hypothetical protein